MRFRIAISALAIVSCAFTYGVEIDMSKAKRESANRISILPKKRAEKKMEVIQNLLDQYKDEDVFISIEGGDSLTWKSLKDWIDYTIQQVKYRADIRDDGMMAMRNMVLQKELSKSLKSFLRYALIAKEARKHGISVDKAQLDRKREEWFETYRKSGAAGEAKLKAAIQPDSFFEHALTNSLLWQAYAEKVVIPRLIISDEEVNNRIKRQEQMISDAVSTNNYKRAKIYEILSAVKYRAKKDCMSFSEAAAKWTDDYNGDIGGVFADENDRPQDIMPGDVIKQVENAYHKLKPGEISDVVETPFSWHIVKLINRNTADDGQEESVNIAHIMLEKVPIPPVLSIENVRHRLTNAKMRIAMEEKYIALLKSEKINCLVPLFEKEEKFSKKKIKQMRKAQ